MEKFGDRSWIGFRRHSVVNGGLEYASNGVENCIEDITQGKSNYFNNSDDRDLNINEKFYTNSSNKSLK